jgi:hypothetical protein
LETVGRLLKMGGLVLRWEEYPDDISKHMSETTGRRDHSI